MRRPLLALMLLLFAGPAAFFAGHRLATRWCVEHVGRPTDDLDWLRLEFRLTDADLDRVRQLHEGYLPKCRHFCARIDAGKRELHTLLDAGTNAPSVIEQRLVEIGTLRARCQSAMIEHFREVSQVMPPDQGRRYLAEMQRLTLGFHEQIERTMSSGPASPHGHH